MLDFLKLTHKIYILSNLYFFYVSVHYNPFIKWSTHNLLLSLTRLLLLYNIISYSCCLNLPYHSYNHKTLATTMIRDILNPRDIDK